MLDVVDWTMKHKLQQEFKNMLDWLLIMRYF